MMQIKNYTIIVFLLSMFLFQSCFVLNKKKNKILDNVMTKDSIVAKLDTIVNTAKLDIEKYKRYLNYKTFATKIKCNFDDGKKQVNFVANLKIKKDSAIQISIIGMGIVEIGRMLLTKDSIYVLDRLHNTAYIKEFPFFTKITGVNLDYETFQNILTNDISKSDLGDINILNNELIFTKKLNDNIESKLAIDTLSKDWKTLQLDYKNSDVNKITLNFSDYKLIQTNFIAMLRKIFIIKKDGVQTVEMNLEKVQLDENVVFNFTIPAKYSLNDEKEIEKLKNQ